MVEDEARDSPATLLEYLPIRMGSGGPQKPSSWLSEDVRDVFTVSTESSEITYPCTSTSSVSPHGLVGS
jgi:hypothetical protein